MGSDISGASICGVSPLARHSLLHLKTDRVVSDHILHEVTHGNWAARAPRLNTTDLEE